MSLSQFTKKNPKVTTNLINQDIDSQLWHNTSRFSKLKARSFM